MHCGAGPVPNILEATGPEGGRAARRPAANGIEGAILVLTTEPPLPRTWWKRVMVALGALVFALGAAGFGMAVYLTHKFSGRHTFMPGKVLGEMTQMALLSFNPQ